MTHLAKMERFKDRLFPSVEPILDFTDKFDMLLKWIRPWSIAIGYDNYDWHLTEPKLEKTMKLIKSLEEKHHIKVWRKELRKAWNEK
jgi:hypothetical protein